MRVAHRGVDDHPLPGIEQPARSARELETATFFDGLASAFGEDEGRDLGEVIQDIFN